MSDIELDSVDISIDEHVGSQEQNQDTQTKQNTDATTQRDPNLKLPGESDMDYWQRQVELARQIPDDEVYVPDDSEDDDELAGSLKLPSELDPKAVQYAETSIQGLWDPTTMQVHRMWADKTSKGWLVEFTPLEGDTFPEETSQFFKEESTVERLSGLSVKGRGGEQVLAFTQFTDDSILIGTPQRQWEWGYIKFRKPLDFDSDDEELQKQAVDNRNTLWFFMRSLQISPKLLEPQNLEDQMWNKKTLGLVINQKSITAVKEVNEKLEQVRRQGASNQPDLDVPKPVHTRPTVVGGGTCEEGIFIDVTPAVGSELSAMEMGKLNLPVIQRESQYANITLGISPNGMSARFTYTVRKPEDPSVAASWSPDKSLMPHGGGKSIAHSIKAGWTPRVPLGSSLPGQETMWLDFVKTPHVAVLGGTASGKSWSLLSWITALGGNFLGQEMVIIDGKTSGDFDALVSPENATHSGVRSIATSAEEAFMMLRWVQMEMNKRKKIQSALKNKGYPEMQFPRLLCVFDEVAFVMDLWSKKVKDEASTIIDQLLKAARAVGIHLFLCAQLPRNDNYKNAWLGNLGLKISMGISEDHMIQRKILGEEGALDNYPEAKSFVSGGIKGRGVMKVEDDKKGEIVTAFRSSHSWSPGKPMVAAGGADWESEKEVWEERDKRYFRRFGFEFTDEVDANKPETFDAAKIVYLDDENFHPIPERERFDPSNMQYEQWSGNQGADVIIED